MEIVEFTKQLYRSGWDDLSDTIVVNSAEEEDGAREDGFKMLSDGDESTPAKRGRKPKADIEA